MNIWFDADNGPHVLVMKPIARELQKQGHQVRFTARDRANTCELLDLYRLEYLRVGGVYGRSSLGKIAGTLARAAGLRKAMQGWKADVSFGHGSRSLPIASRLLKVPSITMYDYEWVSPFIFNSLCGKILLPDAISGQRCIEAGIDVKKARFYPGFKENLYLTSIQPDPAIAQELGLKSDKIRVLLRPPATTAHYHNPEAEEILDALLLKLLDDHRIQLVWLPRTEEQNEQVRGEHKAQVIFPTRVYSGPELILEMDMVIGGGGTMTREAAIMGVPSYSFFRGRRGAVDEKLEELNKLMLIENAADVLDILPEKRPSSQIALQETDTLRTVTGFLTG